MSDIPVEPAPVWSSSTTMALWAMAVSLLLGLLGDQLIFFAPGLGLGGLLWVAALAAGVVGLARWTGQSLVGEGRWLLAGGILFAFGLVWRASPLLQFLNLLAIGICLGLAALTLRGGSLRRTGVLSYPLGLALSAAHHLVGPFSLLFGDVHWQELPKGSWTRQGAAVGRGLLIALPLLLLFGGLFASADAVFAELLGNLIAVDMGRFMGHLFGTLFFAFLAAGFLRTALVKNPGELPQLPRPASINLGLTETGVILGLLNLLFLAFVLVQVRYLFGGADLVQTTVGLTYAEYARRGFFELVQVAVLVLPMLLGLHWLIPTESTAGQRLFRWLGGTLVGLLCVIMASALQRMLLYQAEFGLTELRLYTTAFMAWMALLFGWFLLTVLRGQRERFAVGALVSGLLVLVALNAINPDALIIRTNLTRLEQTGRFDGAYAASLGPDGLPVLLAALPQLSEADRQVVVDQLQGRREYRENWGWTAWNWGRRQALRSLAEEGIVSGGE